MTQKELKELRIEHGMTQTCLAMILGVTGATISRWETGRHNIDDLHATGIRARFAELDAISRKPEH